MANGAYLRGLAYLAASGSWAGPNGLSPDSAAQPASAVAFLLVSSNAAFSFDGTHNFVSSVSAWEVCSTSYIANGANTAASGRLKAPTVSALEDDALSGVYMTTSGLEWVLSDSDIIGAVVTFVSAGLDTPTFSNELLFWHGNGFPQTPNGTLTVNPNAVSGLAYLQSVQNG